MTIKKALKWVMFWMALSLLFNLGIYFFMGKEKALQYLGGYVIEQSLSLDNLFLFLLIFQSFAIPAEYQKRVLSYGILGAIVLRLIFILLGVTIVNKFHWVLYIFGGVLIISGIKMMIKKDENPNFEDSKIIKLLSKIIPISDKLNGEKFFTRNKGVLYATPLLAILVLIEGSDIIFAIDSIPAIFSITTDPFIVYTSNIFAILGLRSLYFILVRLNSMFKYVKYGIALILTFTGIKLLVLFFNVEISIVLSLIVIFSLLIGSILISIISKNTTYKLEKVVNKN